MIKVGVIRGGISLQYSQSFDTGAAVLSALRSETLSQKYKAIDILIDRDGVWHIGGVPAPMEKIAYSVDMIFNALHGDFGEDGKVQQMLDQWHIPYTGSRAFASALGYNKAMAKEQFDRLGIQTARHMLFSAYQKDLDGPLDQYAQAKAKSIWERLPPPWIVKPLTGGSSMGIHVCKTYAELVRAIYIGAGEKVSILVEEMIEGRTATVSVLDDFRGQTTYTFPPVEVRARDAISPGNFSANEKEQLQQLASRIHNGLNLSHYSSSDFIVHPKQGIYALEVNTLPLLSEKSLTEQALESMGVSMPEFIAHVIELAQNT